ncbi:MAG: hypothetical protein ACRCTQ_06450 [Brevinemataceae bacterium]
MRGKSWTILEISSAYRNAKNQARVMIDTYIDQGRRKMSEIYASRWDNAVDLISDLYYDGNHLSCKGIDIEGIPHPCEYGSISSCKATEQKSLLNRLPSNEQSVFTGTIDLKNNKDEAKNILEAWINISNNIQYDNLMAMTYTNATVGTHPIVFFRPPVDIIGDVTKSDHFYIDFGKSYNKDVLRYLYIKQTGKNTFRGAFSDLISWTIVPQFDISSINYMDTSGSHSEFYSDAKTTGIIDFNTDHAHIEPLTYDQAIAEGGAWTWLIAERQKRCINYLVEKQRQFQFIFYG